MKALRALLDSPGGDPAAIAAWLADPTRFRDLKCTACGGEFRVPVTDTSSICSGCHEQGLRAPARRTAVLGNRPSALAAAGCPPRLAMAPFVEPKAWPRPVNRPDFDLAAWKGDPWCVLLLGQVESGKTMLATELFWRLMPTAHSAVWTSAAEIIHATYGDLGEEEKYLAWRRFSTCELLLVDDLGRGHSGSTWDTLTDVLAYRYDHLRPTIVTTNRTMAGEKSRENPHPGLQVEQPQLYRRLQDGLLVGFLERGQWRR